MDVVSEILSPILLVLGLSGVLTGTVRVVRHRTTDGLSMQSTMLGLTANCTWITYGLTNDEPLQIMNNVPMAIMTMLVMVVAWRTGNLPKPHLAFAFAITYAIFATFLIVTIGMIALSVILTTLSVVNRLPQLWESWKEPGGEGVSVPSFGLLIGSSAGWLTYGLIHGQGAVIASSIYGIFSMSFIVIRTVQARRSVERVPAVEVATPALPVAA